MTASNIKFILHWTSPIGHRWQWLYGDLRAAQADAIRLKRQGWRIRLEEVL